jgi:hypothetical protein
MSNVVIVARQKDGVGLYEVREGLLVAKTIEMYVRLGVYSFKR